MRDHFKVLAEKYAAINEVRTNQQTAFDQDELKILVALYNFQIPEVRMSAKLRRVVTPGIVEEIIKYSDESFIVMTDDGRQVKRREFGSFFEMCQGLYMPYKSDEDLMFQQNPKGPDMPNGIEPNGY